MIKSAILLCTAFILGGAQASAQSSYPIADQVAAKVVAKYNTASCSALAAERQAPASAQKDAMKARVGGMLRGDAGMRADFVNKVAPTIVNKMIVCGFIP
jgi:hypothetical protein